MPLDPAFVADCPYDPDALFFDELVEVDREKSLVVTRMPMHADLPLTRSQRVHPVRHPRHLSGGLIVHITGMMGFLHAYYVFDLRHADGWIGYGARIHQARFLNLAEPGAPLTLKAQVTRHRKSTGSILARYTFDFRQGDKVVYEGDQTAMWMKVDGSAPRPFEQQ